MQIVRRLKLLSSSFSPPPPPPPSPAQQSRGAGGCSEERAAAKERAHQPGCDGGVCVDGENATMKFVWVVAVVCSQH